MKKFKVFGLVLLGSIFGLTSCDAPEFLTKIPGLGSLFSSATQKEEKNDEENNNNQQQGGNNEQGGNNQQGGNEQGGNEDNGENLTAKVSDKLTREETGVANASSAYADWTYKSTESKAEYAGKSAGLNDSIQIRSKNKDSGIVTTKSAGKITRVTVEWNEETAEDRALLVYGSNTPYSKPSDLFNDITKGTYLGQIVYGEDESTYYPISDVYHYVGVCSSDGAMYLASVKFSWNGDGEPEVSTEFPLAKVQEVLEGASSEEFPIPTGTAFEFLVDEDYDNSCFVGVHGGDLTAYVAALKEANFDVDEEYADYGYYVVTAPGETLMMDIQAAFDEDDNVDNTAYLLTIYAVQISHEFPQTEVNAYLAEKGISETYPIPEGTKFQHGYDEEYDIYYLYIYGGSSTTYMEALETAGFDKDSSYYESDGCYVFVKGDLDIDVYPSDVGDEAYPYYGVQFMPAED